MKTTRMRMTKDAAMLVHEYRDGHGHKSNTDAIYGLFSDLDAANCNEVFTPKQIAELEAERNKLDVENRCLSINIAMQAESLEKGETALKAAKESLDRKDAHIKRINADLSRGRHLCDELQSYVKRLRKENDSLVVENNQKPSSSQYLFWRAAAVLGWGVLLGHIIGHWWGGS